MDTQACDQLERVHFVGVGGAGMSGIALVLHERGVGVTGSDLKASRYVRELERAGIPVSLGHSAAHIDAVHPQVVVVSSAIPETNPEVVRARELGIDIWPRAQMLSALSCGRTTVAVAGTHGKTTTSSMVTVMLDGMELAPSFLIGGIVEGYDTNGKNGAGQYFVAEADESDGSFLYLNPQVVVVTNVEADHLDHYGTIEALEATFVEFMASVGSEGCVVVCANDVRALALAKQAQAQSGSRLLTYGSAAVAPQADFVCTPHITSGVLGTSATVAAPGGRELTVSLAANPGEHNLLNATACLAVASALHLDLEAAATALSTFKGVRRRFTHVGDAAGVTVVDDYGHHPTEIAATLKAAANLGFGRVVVAFQPHRYSRTQALTSEFGEAFDAATQLYVLDVFSAGETPIPGVSGKSVVNAVVAHNPAAHVTYTPTHHEVIERLAQDLEAGDLLITLGAGDVTQVGPLVLERLREREAAAEAASAEKGPRA
jgi:UDP-N-acetylmuramate--alanine ligase